MRVEESRRDDPPFKRDSSYSSSYNLTGEFSTENSEREIITTLRSANRGTYNLRLREGRMLPIIRLSRYKRTMNDRITSARRKSVAGEFSRTAGLPRRIFWSANLREQIIE